MYSWSTGKFRFTHTHHWQVRGTGVARDAPPTPRSNFFHVHAGFSKNHLKKECIPLGCVLPACCPYLPACTASGGGVSGPRVGGCTWSWRGAAPGPGGCTWSQGVYLVLGGIPGPRGVYLVPKGDCTWSWGVYLVPGGVPGPRVVYLVLGGLPAQVLSLWTEFLTHTSENVTLPQTSSAGGKITFLPRTHVFAPLSGKSWIHHCTRKHTYIHTDRHTHIHANNWDGSGSSRWGRIFYVNLPLHTLMKYLLRLMHIHL